MKSLSTLEKIEEIDDLLTMEEAADYMKIQPLSLYKVVLKKRIKMKKINNKCHFYRKDLIEYKLNKFNRDSRYHQGELIHDLEKGRYSVLHVAKILSEHFKRPVTTQKIYPHLWNGKLKGYRIGATWVILKEDLQKMMSEKDTQISFRFEQSA